MKLHVLPLLFFLTSVLGCRSHSWDLEPIYPKLLSSGTFESRITNGWAMGANIPKVDSLSPTFRWRGLTEDATYDFAIWDALATRESYAEDSRFRYTPGIQIYYREGLQEPSHKTDTELLPRKYYFWSVRKSGTEKWTRINLRNRFVSAKNLLYMFETP